MLPHLNGRFISKILRQNRLKANTESLRIKCSDSKLIARDAMHLIIFVIENKRMGAGVTHQVTVSRNYIWLMPIQFLFSIVALEEQELRPFWDT
jgi:hypothetical protein